MRRERGTKQNKFGFRKGKGTSVVIYVLREIMENIRKERRTIFVCFADLKVAFDKIKREEIWKKLRGKR